MKFERIAERTCRNCRFSAAAPNGSRECRFNPPTANAVLAPDSNGGLKIGAVVSVFPQMNADQFCHQHKPGVELVKGDIVPPVPPFAA